MSEEIEYPLGMEDVRRVLKHSSEIVQTACKSIADLEAANERLAAALTSAHLAGIREGREEAAKLLDARRKVFLAEVGGIASALEYECEMMAALIRALPSPPAGETT